MNTTITKPKVRYTLDLLVETTGMEREIAQELAGKGIGYDEQYALSDSGMDMEELWSRISDGETVQAAIDGLTTAEMQHATQQPTPETTALQAQLDALQAENARLKAMKRKQATISMKISEKGGLSLYGLGRFPVTLYKEQWHRLIEAIDAVKDFLRENDGELASKGDK